MRNPTQCSGVNLGFLNQSLQSSHNKPQKTTRETRLRIWGVYGRFEKRFAGPEKFTRKKARKVFGHEVFEKCTPGHKYGLLTKCEVKIAGY